MKNLKNFFYKKKIIITGHTGFKGSWLVEWLKTYDAKLIGISIDVPTKPSHFQVYRSRPLLH
jgi:CDP-glucose 4,6-dehydratase